MYNVLNDKTNLKKHIENILQEDLLYETKMVAG